jgi:hypothetical protein
MGAIVSRLRSVPAPAPRLQQSETSSVYRSGGNGGNGGGGGGSPSATEITNPTTDTPGKQRWRVRTPPERAAFVHHILVDEEAEAKRLCELLRQQAAQGDNALRERFESLAYQYSRCSSRDRGGTLGWIRPRETTALFDNAIFETKKPAGSIDVVQSEYGWHVVWIGQRLEQQAATQTSASSAPSTTRPSETPTSASSVPGTDYLRQIEKLSAALHARPMPNVFPSPEALVAQRRPRPEGALTHAQALSMLLAHYLEPQTWSVEALAKAFRMEDASKRALMARALRAVRPWLETQTPEGLRRHRELS